MTYLVAIYFAAKNKKNMTEGFFAGYFITFLRVGRKSY